MTQKSPFSLFYNNIANLNKAQNTQFQLQERGKLNKNQFNFEANLQQEKSNKSIKRQSKIKVFGLSEKKKGKEEKQKQLLFSQKQAKAHAQKFEEEFNLLESKTFQRNQIEQSSRKSVEKKQQSINQLHKLLGLSEQISPVRALQRNDENHEIMFSIAQKQQQSHSRLKKSKFQNMSMQSMPTISQKTINFSSRLTQQVPNQVSSKKQIFFDKIESRLLPSELLRRQSSPQKSKVHSRINDLIAQMVQNEKMSPNSHFIEKFELNNSKNQNILEPDLNRLSKNTSVRNFPSQSNRVSQESASLAKAKSCQKFILVQSKIENKDEQIYEKQKKQKQKQKQQQKNSKPYVPLPKKTTKKNETNLGEYLNHYGSYEKEIENLIGRYQKVKELKQKQIEIKQELKNLALKNEIHNNYASVKDYYFPQQSQSLEKSHSSIRLYYTNPYQSTSSNHSEVKSHKKQLSYDSNPLIDAPNPHQTEIQRQLNRNVASMEKIINKFKKISKKIQIASSRNSSMLKTENKHQNNRRGLLQEHYFKTNHGSKPTTSEIQSLQTNTKKSQNIKRLNPQAAHTDIYESCNMANSVEMSQNYKLPLHKQTTLQQFYSIRIPDKRTSRTQKKYPHHFSSEKQRQNKNQECKQDHQHLLKQIKRLNDKVAQLQVDKSKKTSHARKQNIEKMAKSNQEEVQSEQQPSGNISIPRQNCQKSQDFQQQNQSRQILIDSREKDYQIDKNGKNAHKKDHIKEKANERLKKNIQESQEYYKFQQKSKKNSINFPIFYSFPSERDNLSQLVQIGSYMFRILYKFAISRKNRKMRQLSEGSSFKVKRYSHCIHYFTQNQLNYHFVYYFKGNIYFGEWQSQPEGPGYRHGSGYYFHPHKYVYEGQFIRDRKEGFGVAQYTNGQFYEGEWRRNKKQGKGVLINAMGDHYKGQFKSGKKHGRGQQHLSNGDFYKGEFKAGKIEGQGKYVWSDGSVYKGQFKDGKLNGNGVWKSKQNDLFEGKFKDNKKQGEGVYKWSNGIMYAGYFLEGKQKQKMLQQRNMGKQEKKRESCSQKRSKTKERSKKKRLS